MSLRFSFSASTELSITSLILRPEYSSTASTASNAIATGNCLA